MVEDRELESRPGPRQRPVLPITLISRKMVDRWGVEPLKNCSRRNRPAPDLNSPLNWWRGQDFHLYYRVRGNPTTDGSGCPSKVVALDVFAVS